MSSSLSYPSNHEQGTASKAGAFTTLTPSPPLPTIMCAFPSFPGNVARLLKFQVLMSVSMNDYCNCLFSSVQLGSDSEHLDISFPSQAAMVSPDKQSKTLSLSNFLTVRRISFGLRTCLLGRRRQGTLILASMLYKRKESPRKRASSGRA